MKKVEENFFSNKFKTICRRGKLFFWEKINLFGGEGNYFFKKLKLFVREGDIEELPLGPAGPPLAWLPLKDLFRELSEN